MRLPADLRSRPATAADAAAAAALMRACDETYLEWAPAGWRAPELAPARTVRLNAPGRWSHVLLDRGGGLVALVSFRPGFEAESPGAPAGDPLPGVAHLGTLLVHPKVL